MVSWLDGARRARYKVSGLVRGERESVTGKSIKRNGLECKQFNETTKKRNNDDVKDISVVGLFPKNAINGRSLNSGLIAFR
jgi:hypothetical protein